MENMSESTLVKLHMLYGRENIVEYWGYYDSVVIDNKGKFLISYNNFLIQKEFINVEACGSRVYIAVDCDCNAYIIDEGVVTATKIKDYKDFNSIYKTILIHTYNGQQYIARGSIIKELPNEQYKEFVLIDSKTYALIKYKDTKFVNVNTAQTREHFIDTLDENLDIIKKDESFTGELYKRAVYSYMIKDEI